MVETTGVSFPQHDVLFSLLVSLQTNLFFLEHPQNKDTRNHSNQTPQTTSEPTDTHLAGVASRPQGGSHPGKVDVDASL